MLSRCAYRQAHSEDARKWCCLISCRASNGRILVPQKAFMPKHQPITNPLKCSALNERCNTKKRAQCDGRHLLFWKGSFISLPNYPNPLSAGLRLHLSEGKRKKITFRSYPFAYNKNKSCCSYCLCRRYTERHFMPRSVAPCAKYGVAHTFAASHWPAIWNYPEMRWTNKEKKRITKHVPGAGDVSGRRDCCALSLSSPNSNKLTAIPCMQMSSVRGWIVNDCNICRD